MNQTLNPHAPLIIPIFIMNRGCPHRCIFCNQKITAGNFPSEITKEYFDAEVHSYLAWNKDKSRQAEIAFYGGSFTGLDPGDQEKLLLLANAFIRRGLVHSIRISTRPDYISEPDLPALKKNNVTTIELGAQSFGEDVLRFAQRGHDAACIEKAMLVLKKHGFQTGLHLMAGLPRDTREGFLHSLQKTIALRPDTVRIHPVMVFKDTVLAEEFKKGQYKPLELSEAVALCALAWEKLSAAGIKIIRMSLQSTPEMKEAGSILAGPVHPSFGSLVLSSVFLDNTMRLLKKIDVGVKELRFKIAERDISDFRGLNNANITAIKKLYPDANLVVESSPGQPRGVIYAVADAEQFFSMNVAGFGTAS